MYILNYNSINYVYFLLDSVIYDEFSTIEYTNTVNYADVINVVLCCSVPVGTQMTHFKSISISLYLIRADIQH